MKDTTAIEQQKGLIFHLIDYYTSRQMKLDNTLDKDQNKTTGANKPRKGFFELAYRLLSPDLITNQSGQRTFNIYPNRDFPNKVINAFEWDLNEESEAKPLPCVIEVYHCKFCEYSSDIREEIKDHYYHNHINHLNKIEGSYLSRKIDLLITNGEKSYVNSILD